jgi:surface protein
MNKAYLLIICLFLSAFTGCLGTEDLEDNSPTYFQPETRDELKNAVEEIFAQADPKDLRVPFDSANSTYGHINTWDTSLITNMSELFYERETFNGDISDWDVSSVTTMSGMFDGTDDLSDDNKCYIHTEFSSNDNWEYNWEVYCSDD